MPARRVWKAGVLKRAERAPTQVGLEKKDMVRQLVQLHTRKDIAKQRLKQHSRGPRATGGLADTDFDQGKKEASNDLDNAVREMKELREEMRRRGMRF